MKFLNTYDIDQLQSLYGNRDDNVGSAVRILVALRDDVDANSDGWPHWRVPQRAAQQLIALLEPLLNPNKTQDTLRTGIHAAQLRKALTPIRAFYTRAHRGDYGGAFPAINRCLES